VGVLAFGLFFWVLPIIVGQMIGGRKNRKGWAYGLLLGWLGVLIVAVRDAKTDPVQHVTHVHVTAPAAVFASRAALEPATIALPAALPAPVPPAPVMPPAGWYADAQRDGYVRWWDGTAWTEFTAPASAAPSASIVATA
jgi:Protein of unknown function (DUF2510)